MRDDPSARGEGAAAAPPAAGDSFAITVAFELQPGAFPEFHRLLRRNAEASVAREPGCFRFDVLTPLDEETGADVLLYELYLDRAAFDLHLASNHYRRFERLTRAMVRRKTVRAFAAVESGKAGR